MAVVKYKIHELAKDFDLKSKKVIDLLTPYSEGEKKSQTSLTADELDIVFDVLTQENSVSSFEAYFAMKKPEPKAEEAPAAVETPAAEKPAAEAKPAEEPSAPRKEQSDGSAAPARPKDGKAPAPGKKPEPAKTGKPSDPKPFKKKEHAPDAPVQSRTKGERKTVNTRAGGVELDKYNERYENMSSSSYSQRERDGDSKKQKIQQTR